MGLYLGFVFLPLLGSLSSGLLGRYIGYKGSRMLSTGCVLLSCLLSAIVFYKVVILGNELIIHICDWVYLDTKKISWGFNFDSLTCSILLPVLLVSSMVHLYSIGYMSHDPHQQRFFCYLNLFTFFFIILVAGDNFLVMFVGWEMIGVASFLLISFWFTKLEAQKSGLSAILLNRSGDTFLTIGIIFLVWLIGDLNYEVVFGAIPYLNSTSVTIAAICFIICSSVKSAQLGPHIWLALAMAGPTPVSSLLHSSTMVTAGAYLLMRCAPLLEYSSTGLLITLWLGGLTTLASGLIAICSSDIKKVIAYSTMSQLGMMFISIGLSSYNLALYHLITHAAFKALLFMSAGSLIHAVISENQDLRKFGGYAKYLPFTYACFLISSLSLMAIPGLSGFYSKDIIIETAYSSYEISGLIIFYLATSSAILTGLYSIRGIYLGFLSTPNASLYSYVRVHDAPLVMAIPMFILCMLSIYLGYIIRDYFIGLGSTEGLGYSLFIHPDHLLLPDTEFSLPIIIKLLPLIASVVLSSISLILFEFSPSTIVNWKIGSIYKIYFNKAPITKYIYDLFINKFYFDHLLNNIVLRYSLYFAGHLNKTIDKGILQIFTTHGLSSFVYNLGFKFKAYDTTSPVEYSLFIIYNVIIISLLLLFINILHINMLYVGIIIITIISISPSRLFNISKDNQFNR